MYIWFKNTRKKDLLTMKLRTYFIIIFTVFIIVFTAIISSIITEESSQIVEKHISQSLTEKAYQLSDQLDHFMWSRYGELTVISKLDTFQEEQNSIEISKLLNELKSNIPSYSWIGVTDATGYVRATTDDILIGVDISERPVFKEATKQTFIGDVHEAVLLAKLLPNPTGEPLQFVDISAPIFNQKGDFQGVLAAHLSWEWAREVQRSVIQPIQQQEEKVDVFIISKKNNTILLGPKDMVGQSIQLNALNKAQSGQNKWSLETWPDGKRYLTGYALANGLLNYPGLEWSVLVRQPEEVAFRSVTQLRNKVISLGLLFSLLFAGIGWYLAYIISNPLRKLAITTEQLRNGNRVKVTIKKGIREIETLATSLSHLIETLTRTESDLGRMESIAFLDKLTGLPNRLALEQYLTNIDNSLDNEQTRYALLCIDLDGFKHVNDQYGHHHGDLLLNAVATRLKDSISMKKNDFICRLGGDEFVVILQASKWVGNEDIDHVGNRIIQSMNEPFDIEGSIVNIGCSIGTASWPTHDQDLYQVLRYADKALYTSKENGKNQLSYFTE
jgi:diguanylate cyclase (GGDEF)-like protein